MEQMLIPKILELAPLGVYIFLLFFNGDLFKGRIYSGGTYKTT